eukprot:Partr_v1_DN28582_c0_g1_i5_m73244 putative Armadillo repeat containing 8
MTQVSIVLGSFAYGLLSIVLAQVLYLTLLCQGSDVSVETLVNAGAMKPLLEAMISADLELAEASARALKILLQNPGVPREEVMHSVYIDRLVGYLGGGADSAILVELSAAIVARCCESASQQEAFQSCGAVDHILSILSGGVASPRTLEACLDALAAFLRQNVVLARSIVASKSCDVCQMLLKHLHDKRSSMRLIAATCYANLYRTKVIESRQQEIIQHVLPVIVKLFQEPSLAIRERAPLVLAYLVSDSDDLQKAASEVDAVPKLAQLFTSAFASFVASEDKVLDHKKKKHVHAPVNRMCENVLIAIAGICSIREECRKQVVDSRVLPLIVKAMEHPDVGIRIAACQSTRSLSRSVRNLRTSLVDAGVAMPLFHLLSDKSTEVQTIASATLCNIVLDFSPMKKVVLDNGGVEKLVELTSSMIQKLRLNCVWALKNLLFQADSATKKFVMDKLTFAHLLTLIEDSDIEVQEQAVNLLRNVACKEQSDIDMCFQGLGPARLMKIIEAKLQSAHEEIILQALYVVVNLATGSDEHKEAIMKHEPVLEHILTLMAHEKALVKVATIWVIINLTWTEEVVATSRI